MNSATPGAAHGPRSATPGPEAAGTPGRPSAPASDRHRGAVRPHGTDQRRGADPREHDAPGERQRPAHAPGAPGLREQRKQRTRDALIRTALELFVEGGYEHTTVDEIAEAVAVSQRTFFRYFANKEEVVFAVQEMAEQGFLRAVAERPADEPPLEALRNAVLTAWGEVGEAIESVIPLELHMRTCHMIESTPTLLAVHLRRFSTLEEEIARLVARREGVHVETDPRPRVVVSAFGGVMRVAGRLWGESGDCSVDAIRRLTEDYLDQIRPAFERDWRRPGG